MTTAKKILKAEGTENTGHGHVYTRPDGVRMRCGGPGMCAECSKDLARLQMECGQTPDAH